MIESKPWEWSKLNEEGQKKWKEPSIESYYLINRWKKQNKKDGDNYKMFVIKLFVQKITSFLNESFVFSLFLCFTYAK